MMTELIAKMVLCLVAALILGFLIGWLLSKLAHSKNHLMKVDALSSSLDEKNETIELLKKENTKEKSLVENFVVTNKKLKGSLNDKESLIGEQSIQLDNVQKELHLAQSNVSESLRAKEDNKALLHQLNILEKSFYTKEAEIHELETVLVKAEERIEEKSKLATTYKDEMETIKSQTVEQENKGVQALNESLAEKEKLFEQMKNKVEELTIINDEKAHSITLYQDTISQLENELKLYSVDGKDDEFIISKDQFTHIESKLADYQKEILLLKDENNMLKGKDKKVMPENTNHSELDDIAIVKLFRDTYKKITKS